MNSEPLYIYFHWPYCKSKCPYCDFFKRVEKNTNQQELIDSYCRELEYYHQLLPHRQIRSVFFGGGTPSLMAPGHIARLLDKISALWSWAEKPEISLEANPNSEYPDMFKRLKQAGINRLSLGVQALDDSALRFLGRTHNRRQAEHCIEQILTNFDNHSMDLIYARPAQTLQMWEKELQEAVSFGLKHLSLYQLTIEEGTVFAAKNIKPADENIATEMYQFTVDFLRTHGYPRYEVSNFASSAYESIHNKCYWQGEEYIGIGESAHGRIKLNGTHYAVQHPHILEELTDTERAEELIIMGLRLQKGINKKMFKSVCNLNFDDFINSQAVKDFCDAGYLLNTVENIAATDKGFLVLDKIIEEICFKK